MVTHAHSPEATRLCGPTLRLFPQSSMGGGNVALPLVMVQSYADSLLAIITRYARRTRVSSSPRQRSQRELFGKRLRIAKDAVFSWTSVASYVQK
jgi:membrane protein implicated in regulation of membrane protease activity